MILYTNKKSCFSKITVSLQIGIDSDKSLIKVLFLIEIGTLRLWLTVHTAKVNMQVSAIYPSFYFR